MKKLIVMGAALLSFNALADIKFKPVDFHQFEKPLYYSSVNENILGGTPVQDQVFQIENDGRKIGTFIAGKGFNSNDDNVCFIGWAEGESKVITTIPTIGYGQWEAEVCNETKAVSIISKDNNNPKIAVIYEASSPNANAWESVIFDVNHSGLTIDKELTDKFGSQGAKTVNELKALIK